MDDKMKDDNQNENCDCVDEKEDIVVQHTETVETATESETEDPSKMTAEEAVASVMSSVFQSLAPKSDNVVFDADEEPTTEEAPQEDPDAGLTEEELIEKYICNVFERGSVDVPFILDVPCSVCMFKRKKAKEMVVYRNKLLHRIFPGEEKLPNDQVIGVVTMCQNCGHLDVFGCDIDDVLLYLRGKTKKQK